MGRESGGVESIDCFKMRNYFMSDKKSRFMVDVWCFLFMKYPIREGNNINCQEAICPLKLIFYVCSTSSLVQR